MSYLHLYFAINGAREGDYLINTCSVWISVAMLNTSVFTYVPYGFMLMFLYVSFIYLNSNLIILLITFYMNISIVVSGTKSTTLFYFYSSN